MSGCSNARIPFHHGSTNNGRSGASRFSTSCITSLRLPQWVVKSYWGRSRYQCNKARNWRTMFQIKMYPWRKQTEIWHIDKKIYWSQEKAKDIHETSIVDFYQLAPDQPNVDGKAQTATMTMIMAERDDEKYKSHPCNSGSKTHLELNGLTTMANIEYGLVNRITNMWGK